MTAMLGRTHQSSKFASVPSDRWFWSL